MKNKNSFFKQHFFKSNGLLVILFILGFGIASFAAFRLISDLRDDRLSRNEYNSLRSIINITRETPTPTNTPSATQGYYHYDNNNNNSEVNNNDNNQTSEQDETIQTPVATPSPPFSVSTDDVNELIRLNNDFVGWIHIEGTRISYPVVQTDDNDYYLHRTFSRRQSQAGSIFMDYRVPDAFESPLIILYGHNNRDGTMFADVMGFGTRGYMNSHTSLVIFNRDGEKIEFTIFAVRWTDAWDAVYQLDFHDETAIRRHFNSAPADANRFLVLSTCSSNTDLDARLIVLAYAR